MYDFVLCLYVGYLLFQLRWLLCAWIGYQRILIKYLCVMEHEQRWQLLVRRNGTSMCQEIESIGTVIVQIVLLLLGIGKQQELIG